MKPRKRTIMLNFKVNEAELKAFKKKALEAQLNVSQFIRKKTLGIEPKKKTA